MKFTYSIIAALGLTATLAASATAATTDPEVLVYRAAGVMDSGSGAFVGVATVFQCTNISGTFENIRFVTRNLNSVLVSNSLFGVSHLQTFTVSTHGTTLYGNTTTLSPGQGIGGGTTAIAATTTNIFCTARTVDASASVPSGIVLPMVRFNPMPATEE